MYWNEYVLDIIVVHFKFNRNIWCIEMQQVKMSWLAYCMFNRNIWCIEISGAVEPKAAAGSLTETYDVLK